MPDGHFQWNTVEIARALKIKESDVKLYFTDGRRVSFLLERRLAYEFFKGTVAESEGAGFDIIDSEGNKWEARSITKGGVYFSPSYMVGSSRHFEERGFLEKLGEVRGYILSDVEEFPDVPFWIVDAKQVLEWWKAGQLGTNSKITMEKALELIKSVAGNKL